MLRQRIARAGLAGLIVCLCITTACARKENGKADPLQALDPFCRNSSPFRLHAVIEVDGERLEDAIVVQHTQSRGWIRQLNASGCSEVFGTTLVFRSRDGRAILMPPRLCRAAEALLESGGAVDVAGVCLRDVDITSWPQGVVIDDADRPTTWTAFDFDAPDPPGRLLSLTAQRTSEPPRDNLDAVAPALLRTHLDSAETSDATVDQLIAYARRSRDAEPFIAVENRGDGSARWRSRAPPHRQLSADAGTEGVGRENYTPPYRARLDRP